MRTPLDRGTGHFLAAVAIVFVPLMILSDWSPKYALLWAVAASLFFVVKFAPGTFGRWWP